MDLEVLDEIAALPKAELHLHLEGSVRPATLLELARRHRVDLPADTLPGLREWFRFRDFNHFIEVYIAITKCLRTRDDYELIVAQLAQELVGQNVRYAEVTFSPGTHKLFGVKEKEYLEGLTAGRRRAKEELGVELHWVFDIVRNADNREKESDYVTSLALDCREIGVVALGLGGKEEGHPPQPFSPYFERIKEEGMKSTPHAGELVGPASVRGAIEYLHADRIGHGVRSIEDSKLVDLLAERRIPLEVCPTSNLRLGVYDSFAKHPARSLHEAGVIVTLNTDDPPLFETSHMDEYRTALVEMKIDPEMLLKWAANAMECRFVKSRP